MRQTTYGNTNGIMGKRDGLVQFLQEFTVDVMLVQEAYLKSSKSLRIPNYETHKERVTTAALVKNETKYLQLPRSEMDYKKQHELG